MTIWYILVIGRMHVSWRAAWCFRQPVRGETTLLQSAGYDKKIQIHATACCRSRVFLGLPWRCDCTSLGQTHRTRNRVDLIWQVLSANHANPGHNFRNDIAGLGYEAQTSLAKPTTSREGLGSLVSGMVQRFRGWVRMV